MWVWLLHAEERSLRGRNDIRDKCNNATRESCGCDEQENVSIPCERAEISCSLVVVVVAAAVGHAV